MYLSTWLDQLLDQGIITCALDQGIITCAQSVYLDSYTFKINNLGKMDCLPQ